MNRTFIFIIAFISLFTVSAKCDRFIFKGDTTYLDVNSPLEQYEDIKELRKNWLATNQARVLTATNDPMMQNGRLLMMNCT